MKNKMNLIKKVLPSWCPGCFNFQILAGVSEAIKEKIKSKLDKKNFAIVTGIGCHAKIFDYLDLAGINTLHGRVIPTCLGMKMGNPSLNVIGFSGDGDAYSEGIEHLIHAARYNSNFKYLVHNNQVFALTAGQPTGTTEIGYQDKTTPQGVSSVPINPIKLMLASGATFVARVFAEKEQVKWVLNEAINHKGFAFIEILQPCIIFHNADYKSKTYLLNEKNHQTNNLDLAFKRAAEFDYNSISKETKIPLGIFYKKEEKTLEEKMLQTLKLLKFKKSWKESKK